MYDVVSTINASEIEKLRILYKDIIITSRGGKKWDMLNKRAVKQNVEMHYEFAENCAGSHEDVTVRSGTRKPNDTSVFNDAEYYSRCDCNRLEKRHVEKKLAFIRDHVDVWKSSPLSSRSFSLVSFSAKKNRWIRAEQSHALRFGSFLLLLFPHSLSI